MKTKPFNMITAGALVLGCLTGWSVKADDATDLWNHNCAICHGKDGKADTMMGHMLQMKDLTDPKVQASFTDAEATKTIKEGLTENGKTKMKPFAEKLTDDQIKELVAHVRSLKAAK